MSRFTDRLITKGILVNDPTKSINSLPSPGDYAAPYGSNGSGLWNNQNINRGPIEDPFERRLREMENQMQLVQLDLKFSRLKILSLEGKFTQEEVANIRKMLMSEDQAAKTLADSIIENA